MWLVDVTVNTPTSEQQLNGCLLKDWSVFLQQIKNTVPEATSLVIIYVYDKTETGT